MKFARYAWTALLLAPFIAGCAGFWQDSDSSSTSGCTSSCTTASSGNFYILSGGSSPSIVGQSFVSGKLTSISGSPWALTATPYAMAIAPGGSYLYVATTLPGVLVYPVTSGVLGSSTQITQDTALAVRVDTTGAWLIEAIQATGGVTLAAVPISTSTGGVNGTEQSATYSIANAAVQPGKIAIAPDDKYIFVALGAGGVIAVPFNAAVTSGSSPFASTAYTIPVVNSAGSALSVAVDPSSRLFYIGETLANSSGNSGGLRVFNYSSLGGTLTQATGSPIASGGLAPNSILPAANGSYIYVANGQGTSSSGNIAGFTITSSTSAYTIAAGVTATAGKQPAWLAQDKTAAFVLNVNSSGSPYFSSYTFDSTTAGKLDVQVVASTPTSPLQIVAAP